MIQSNTFTYNIPTHIGFTLFKNDYFDNIIITNVHRYCKNYNDTPGTYTVRVSAFIDAIKKNEKIKAELENNSLVINSAKFKPNSAFFIKSIFERLPNLTMVTIKVSYEKQFSRITKTNNKVMANFHYNVLAGILSLSDLLTITQINSLNKILIKQGILPKSYLLRKSCVEFRIVELIELLEKIPNSEITMLLSLLEEFDAKLDIDNPIITVKTDYSIL